MGYLKIWGPIFKNSTIRVESDCLWDSGIGKMKVRSAVLKKKKSAVFRTSYTELFNMFDNKKINKTYKALIFLLCHI